MSERQTELEQTLTRLEEIQKRHTACDEHQRYGSQYTASDLIRDAEEAHRDRATLISLVRKALQDKREWRPIETAPKGQKLIVGYANTLGKWRTVTATYYLPQTLEIDESDYDADDGDGWAKEGWYEETETHETLMPLDGSQTPTHWMPLPAAPAEGSE